MNSSYDGAPTARPVLVAIDGSISGADAVDWAVQEARSRRANLRIVHVCAAPTMWDPTAIAQAAPDERQVRDRALRILCSAEESVRTTAPELDVETVLGMGNPARVIRAESRRAGLTVLGRGRGRRRSVASHVLAQRSSPVSVIGSLVPTDRWSSPDRIVALVQSDRAPSTVLAVLDLALGMARRRRWPVTVMANWSDVWQAGLGRAILLTRAHTSAEVVVETASRPGPVAAPLLAARLSSTMVVMAPPRRLTADTSRGACDQQLASGASTTFVSRRSTSRLRR